MGGEKMVIGLTGGIATGKSTVSSLLLKHGAYLIDGDRIAREVVEVGKPAYHQIIAHFGEGICQLDGSIDRKKLGRIVFSDPHERKKLESITHPYIFEEIRRRIHEAEEARERLIILDVPLLFETGLEKEADLTLLVDADEAEQVRRIMARDHLTEEEAKARIASQWPMEEKRKRADYILSNRGNLEDLEREVEEFLRWVEERRDEG